MTAADLRAALARRRIRIYEFAPRIGLHPNRLGLLLNEHAPISPSLAHRIACALAKIDEAPATQ
jgi:plasmid maintenance system antidote protein VapI